MRLFVSAFLAGVVMGLFLAAGGLILFGQGRYDRVGQRLALTGLGVAALASFWETAGE